MPCHIILNSYYLGIFAMNTSNFFDQVVGIIGGTGPEATNYFTSLLVKMRGPVRNDQDHIPFLLINNPQIPDRSIHSYSMQYGSCFYR